jgi:hypothetical protein
LPYPQKRDSTYARRGYQVSFTNLYAIYVIIKDYIANEYDKKGDYSAYEGVLFNKLFARQRKQRSVVSL